MAPKFFLKNNFKLIRMKSQWFLEFSKKMILFELNELDYLISDRRLLFIIFLKKFVNCNRFFTSNF